MTRRLAPAHAAAAGLCAGLAFANLERVQAVLLVVVPSALAVLALRAPAARLVAVALLAALAGWWWGSVRLEALDRSLLSPQVGRAGRATVVITSEPRAGRYEIRATGMMRVFRGTAIGEPVELELPRGRAPPQGAILDALAVVKEPRGPAHGFDERTWLRRHGIHVVVRLDEWRTVGRRGGLGGLGDRLRRGLARAIAPGLTGERRAVLEGIVLGDDTALSDGLRTDFRASGLYHILTLYIMSR